MDAGALAMGTRTASWTHSVPDSGRSHVLGLLQIGAIPIGHSRFSDCETERSMSRMTYLPNSARWGSVR